MAPTKNLWSAMRPFADFPPRRESRGQSAQGDKSEFRGITKESLVNRSPGGFAEAREDTTDDGRYTQLRRPFAGRRIAADRVGADPFAVGAGAPGGDAPGRLVQPARVRGAPRCGRQRGGRAGWSCERRAGARDPAAGPHRHRARFPHPDNPRRQALWPRRGGRERPARRICDGRRPGWPAAGLAHRGGRRGGRGDRYLAAARTT